MEKEVLDYVSPHYHKEKNIVFGRLDGYDYAFSADLKNMFFYRLTNDNPVKRVEMTNSEITRLLNVLLYMCDEPFKPMLRMIQFSYMQSLASKSKKDRIDDLKENKVFVTRHNTSNQDKRKAAQRDKQLLRYSTIPPVLSFDENKNAKTVSVKMDNEYYHILLDEKKPAFWKISLTKSSAMSVEELSNFIDYMGQSPKFESLVNGLAPLYGKFVQTDSQKLTDWQREVLFSKIKMDLGKGLQSFSSVERMLCVKSNEHQR